MNLTESLRILVVDWQALHEEGGTKLSAEQVVGRLYDGSGKSVPPGLKSGQIAELILEELRRMPGAWESTEKYLAQFDSPDDLLEEIDLECLVADLTVG